MAVNSLVIRSPIPANMVVPPDSTTLPYRSLRMSTSHFMMDWNSLNGNIHGRDVESLKHDLRHSFAVGPWVERCLCQEHRMLLRCNTQLVVESVVPDLLHVIPVGH